jgi:hypothetical protein
MRIATSVLIALAIGTIALAAVVVLALLAPRPIGLFVLFGPGDVLARAATYALPKSLTDWIRGDENAVDAAFNLSAFCGLFLWWITFSLVAWLYGLPRRAKRTQSAGRSSEDH